MRIRCPIFIFLCLGSFALAACEDADEPPDVSEEDISETAIAPEKEEFQRRARAYLDELTEIVDSLEASERAPDTLLAAIEEGVDHLRKEIAEVEEMTAVVYRDRHDELQERLYALEGGVVAAQLSAAPTRSRFIQAARRHLAERERAMAEFARESAPKGRDPQTPHASDLGELRAVQEHARTMIERLEAGDIQFSSEVQRDIAEEIGELTADLRRARDLVEYPELQEP